MKLANLSFGSVGRAGLLAAVLVASTSVGAVTEVGAAALQTGNWRGQGQSFYNSGWDEHVGPGSASAGHALYDTGAFSVSSYLSSSHGLYTGDGTATANGTSFSAASQANFELQGTTRDTLQVVSSSLPVGTPISVEVRLFLTAPAVPGVRATLTVGAVGFNRLDVVSGTASTRLMVQQYDGELRVGDSFLVDTGYQSYWGRGGGLRFQPRGGSAVLGLLFNQGGLPALCGQCIVGGGIGRIFGSPVLWRPGQPRIARCSIGS